jgi:hypothetical protein
MTLSLRILARWIQLSALATALSLMVYITAQQVGRETANDPQIQIARDARDGLAAGQPVESVVPAGEVSLERSLASWVTILDDSGAVIASSGRLHGQLHAVPIGVLDNIRSGGEGRVTWQPEPGVRMATVAERVPGPHPRFVLVGRSLDETENRISHLGWLLLLGWAGTIVGLLVVVAASEALITRDR